MKRFFLLVVSLAAAVAGAQTYTYQFSGYLTNFSPSFTDLVPDAHVDQTFTGWFNYHSEPGLGTMGTATQQTSLVFSIGDFTLNHHNDDQTLLFLDNPTTGSDFFRVYAYGTQGDVEYWRTGLSFSDSTRTAFDSDSAIPELLTMDMFDEDGIKMSFDSDHGYMYGAITSLTVVPEPASLILLLTGGLMLRSKRH